MNPTAPLINPILFYFVGMSDDVKTVCTIIAVLSALTFVGFMSWKLYLHYDDSDTTFNRDNNREEETHLYKAVRRIVKGALITFIISISVGMVTPSKETSYAMLAASVVTPANISSALETGANVTDFITDQVKKLMPGNESSDKDKD